MGDFFYQSQSFALMDLCDSKREGLQTSNAKTYFR